MMDSSWFLFRKVNISNYNDYDLTHGNCVTGKLSCWYPYSSNCNLQNDQYCKVYKTLVCQEYSKSYDLILLTCLIAHSKNNFFPWYISTQKIHYIYFINMENKETYIDNCSSIHWTENSEGGTQFFFSGTGRAAWIGFRPDIYLWKGGLRLWTENFQIWGLVS